MKIAILIGLVIAIIAVVVLLLRNNSSLESDEGNSSPPPSNDPKPSSMKKLNWIQGAGGEVGGKTYHIGQRSVTIGRAPTNFIQIMDPNVSRFHVRLTPVDDGLELQDMNSSTGTKVNDEFVTKARLHTGDTFTIGDAFFIFHREANYTVNEGLVGRKDIGGDAIKPTLIEDDGELINSLVMKALGEHGGDVIKVAQLTNLSVDVVENIRNKYKARS